MGLIRIHVTGSFAAGGMAGEEDYSAMEHGHTDAVEKAIEYLTDVVLPKAIRLDLKLASENDYPGEGFGPTIRSKL